MPEGSPSSSGTGSKKRISPGLLALSSAAILTVYTAGYLRTRTAAERFAIADRRQPVVPAPAASAGPVATAPVVAVTPITPAAAAPTSSTPEVRSVRVKRARTAPKPAPAGPATPVAPAAEAPVATPPVTASVVSTPADESSAHVDAKPDAKPQEPALQKPALKDGTYSGWGTSRHGDIKATVVIEDGRIVSASIAECWTRYPCSWIAHLPGQIVSRQSPECDFVSGATQSTNAFYYAVVEALAKAK